MKSSQILEIFIAILIGTSLVGAIANVAAGAREASLGMWYWANNASVGPPNNVTGLTGASLFLTGIIALFFILVLVVGIAKYFRD